MYMDAYAISCVLWSYLQLVDIFNEALPLHVHLNISSARVSVHSYL